MICGLDSVHFDVEGMLHEKVVVACCRLEAISEVDQHLVEDKGMDEVVVEKLRDCRAAAMAVVDFC